MRASRTFVAASDIREILGAEPSLRLPDGTSVLEVAEACRNAVMTFVAPGVAPVDEKRALAAWLVGPYRQLCGFVATPSRKDRISEPVRSEQVKEIHAYARAHVLGVIRDMARDERDLSFSVAAVRNGWIEKCVDDAGKVGWVPVDRPKMRLTERVLSLLAVDYLLRPSDWLDGVVLTDNIHRIAI